MIGELVLRETFAYPLLTISDLRMPFVRLLFHKLLDNLTEHHQAVD
ncbi:hypothetical protein AXXA_23050 [Achromobacter insuavis AXX-A]|uniref:Uncharacterized protein n=1 Tax=Achromobacter insuavis AXX-A TaxID=1003200 RepID=F7T6M0_9BURK|nr:hypothetical protein AXXA_23050 [Achromobacter insuavis AXX-A]